MKTKFLSLRKKMHNDVVLRLLEQLPELGPKSDLLFTTNSRLILEAVSMPNLPNTESAQDIFNAQEKCSC